MSKEIKEFKVTCKGCNTVTFFPFVDFENEEKTKAEKNKGCLSDAFLTTAATSACLPLGCLCAGQSIRNKQMRDLPPEERKKVYCNATICSKCRSTALEIETVTHIIK